MYIIALDLSDGCKHFYILNSIFQRILLSCVCLLGGFLNLQAFDWLFLKSKDWEEFSSSTIVLTSLLKYCWYFGLGIIIFWTKIKLKFYPPALERLGHDSTQQTRQETEDYSCYKHALPSSWVTKQGFRKKNKTKNQTPQNITHFYLGFSGWSSISQRLQIIKQGCSCYRKDFLRLLGMALYVCGNVGREMSAFTDKQLIFKGWTDVILTFMGF